MKFIAGCQSPCIFGVDPESVKSMCNFWDIIEDFVYSYTSFGTVLEWVKQKSFSLSAYSL
jgi:hypothetical protein